MDAHLVLSFVFPTKKLKSYSENPVKQKTFQAL